MPRHMDLLQALTRCQYQLFILGKSFHRNTLLSIPQIFSQPSLGNRSLTPLSIYFLPATQTYLRHISIPVSLFGTVRYLLYIPAPNIANQLNYSIIILTRTYLLDTNTMYVTKEGVSIFTVCKKPVLSSKIISQINRKYIITCDEFIYYYIARFTTIILKQNTNIINLLCDIIFSNNIAITAINIFA